MRNYHGGNFCYSSLFSIFLLYDLNLAMRIKRMRTERKTHNETQKRYHIQHIIHEKMYYVSQFRFAKSRVINRKQSKFVLSQSKFVLSKSKVLLSQSKFRLSV